MSYSARLWGLPLVVNKLGSCPSGESGGASPEPEQRRRGALGHREIAAREGLQGRGLGRADHEQEPSDALGPLSPSPCLTSVPAVAEVLVVWNGDGAPDPSLFNTSAPVRIRREAKV